MDFFIDRNVPEKLARMLGHYDRDHDVIYHDDRFDKMTSDTEWLDDIATWKPIPVVVSGDGRILKNRAELQVLQGLPITFFLLAPAWCSMPWHDQAWKMIKVWPKVVAAASPPRPSVFKIPSSTNKIDFISYTADIRKRKQPKTKKKRR